ncbi:MAG: SUF system NifU family Fe-S cluster assembly protein [Geothrix sp.]|uniref:Fe-S cluster assembly sulfur transfer protein SufU n=1 Tax=Geothrix sp. TaxID=1962974 RepID=UPI001829046A|nr:SUF system NifU family Fe-S cluster assembly protein [Geothrix sp.]NWJ40574.1 SUF system NifU family Fe-S cluster assembly protein [Geothrix sp.]WIL21422.1 MAG: SUF system NifU family Fe-S cluster assembly protein [Geothrix sp.]
MSDPRELYQQVILEHNKKPRNFGKLETCTHHADGHNPLCGDELTLTLVIENGLVQDIKFQGSGCAIDVASASLMTGAVKGRPVVEAEAMAEQFRGMVRGELEPGIQTPLLGKLTLFSGVKDLPSRVKCAVLPWATLHAALKGEAEASTE